MKSPTEEFKISVLLHSYKRITLFMLPFLIMLILRLKFLTIPLETDEGVYAYIASAMNKGLLPYINIFDHKPPLIYSIYQVAQFFDRTNIWGPRLIALFSIMGAMIVTGLIAYIEYGYRVSYLTLWFFLIYFSLPLLTPFAANTEIFLLFPLMLSVLIYKIFNETDHWFYLLAFGLFCGLTLMLKPITLGIVLINTFLLLKKVWKSNKNIRRQLVKTSFIVYGAILPLIVFCQPYITKQGLSTFIEDVVIYNYFYAYNHNLLRTIPVAIYMILCLPNLLFLLIFILFHKDNMYKYYLMMVLGGLLFIFQSDILHYYIILIPFLAIISAVCWPLIFKLIIKLIKGGPKFTKTLIISCIVFIFIAPILNLLVVDKYQLVGITYPKLKFLEAKNAADYLKSNSDKDDRIFIASSDPEVLSYTGRESISSLIYFLPLLQHNYFSVKLGDQLKRELTMNKPDYIVYNPVYFINSSYQNTMPKDISDFIRHYINNAYHLEVICSKTNACQVSDNKIAAEYEGLWIYKLNE